jgi:two-component system cell cycle sensor histidine kinase/response regulator CckA
LRRFIAKETRGKTVNDQLPPPYVTALVVDDERISRHVASRMLRELGMRVLEADGAEEALDVFRISKQPIDLVLLDVVMPETDGVDLAEQILAHRPGQRIIFMSAYPAEVLAEHGLHDLDVVFLAKPYTLDELQARVRQAMDRAPSRETDPAWRTRRRE